MFLIEIEIISTKHRVLLIKFKTFPNHEIYKNNVFCKNLSISVLIMALILDTVNTGA